MRMMMLMMMSSRMQVAWNRKGDRLCNISVEGLYILQSRIIRCQANQPTYLLSKSSILAATDWLPSSSYRSSLTISIVDANWLFVMCCCVMERQEEQWFVMIGLARTKYFNSVEYLFWSTTVIIIDLEIFCYQSITYYRHYRYGNTTT